jgi:uncharacterized repeat protein (TIGR02543 family)
MSIQLRAGNVWKNVSQIKLRSGGVWKNVAQAYLRTGGSWKSLFSDLIFPSIENRVTVASSGGINAGSTIMNNVNVITLISTRYHWDDADVFTYIWQKSPDNVTWSNIGIAQSTTNPASGSSSSSITRVLSPSDFTSGPDMYFRFVSNATNSTASTSSSSQSLPILISYYGVPTPAPGSPSITGSTTVGSTNAYGNIGSWTNSPTSYFYQFRFTSGLTSYPLTDIQTRSVSAKTLSGYSATLTTSSSHGYRVGDTFTVSGMDTLFNGSYSITSVGSSTISFTINTPTAWANAGTGYSSGTYVSSGGNAYISNQTISSVSQFNGGTLYSAGAIVYFGNNRYQSKLNNNIGNSVTNTTWWDDLGSFATGGSRWTIQSFSNTAASGSTTGYVYFDGTVYSSTLIPVPINSTDAKTLIDLRGKVLTFGVKAYNQATLSPSEYSGTAFIYGYPVITVGTITAGSTFASIPYTQSYMTEYDIDIKYLGISISGYPKTVTSPSSPISVTGLLAPRTYTYTISPKNGEGTYGLNATGSFTTVAAPTISNISAVDSTVVPSSASSISVSNTPPSNTGSVSWSNGSNLTTAWLYSMSGAASGGTTTDPGTLNTTGSITVNSTGSATATIRAVNKTKRVDATWSQTNAQSYLITYSVAGAGINEIEGNSSASNPSVLIYSTTATTAAAVTITNITVYSGLNQTGNSSSLNSSSSITATNKTTDTAGSGSVTFTAPAVAPSGGTAFVSPTSGTAGSTTFTASTSGWSGTAPITFAYSWQWMNSSFNWTPVASGTTFTPTIAQNGSAIAWRVVVTATNSVGSATATAGFTVNNPQYTVTYNANGGTVSPTSATVNAGSSVTLPSPSRSGFTFNGWYTSSSGGSFLGFGGTSYTPSSSITIFAQWTAIQYTVTWNANGGTVSPTSATVNAGSSVTAPTPTRSGFTFSTWRNPLSGGDPIFVSAGGSYTPTASITFYAIWTAPTPNVTQITALGLGNTTAPYIRFTFTSTNASSLSIMLYRSATSSTGPWTALSSRNIRTTSGTVAVDFSSRTGTTSNWYYVDVIPYSNSDGTGTAGTTRTSRVKRGTETTTTTVYP